MSGVSFAQTIHSLRPGERQEGLGKELKDMGSFVVTAITDPTTFVLADKRVLRLTGVDIPVYPGEKESPFAALALQRMQGLFLGQKVALFQTRDEKKGRMGALGHALGHVAKREGDNKPVWAQEVLVREGLARALPTVSNPEGATLLFAAEEKPRTARQGLWGSQQWSVKSPDTVDAYIGTIQVVEGTIKNVGTRQNYTFLNFGQDFKTDFTVVIDSETRRAMMRNGVNPLGLSGKTVEVRGFVESYNGPSIQLDNPMLLRVLKTPEKQQ